MSFGTWIYKNLIKPVLFLFPPDLVHNFFISFRENMGVRFSNPVGLSAGFDYNGRLLKILPSIGFGFSTVGTVTRLPSLENLGPHYIRLPKSNKYYRSCDPRLYRDL